MEVKIASLSVWIHKELPLPFIRLAAKWKFTSTVFLLWMFTPALALGLSPGEDQGPSRAALLEAQHQAAPQTVLPQERSPAARALPRGEEVSRFVANLLRVWKGFISRLEISRQVRALYTVSVTPIRRWVTLPPWRASPTAWTLTWWLPTAPAGTP